MIKLSLGTIATIATVLLAWFTLGDRIEAASWRPALHGELAMTDGAVRSLTLQLLNGQINDRYSDLKDALAAGDAAYAQKMRNAIRLLEYERNGALCEQWQQTHRRACPPPPSSILGGP